MFYISVSCLCSDQSEFTAVFMDFNLWIAPGLFMSLLINF